MPLVPVSASISIVWARMKYERGFRVAIVCVWFSVRTQSGLMDLLVSAPISFDAWDWKSVSKR